MIDLILNLKSIPSEFSIEADKSKFINYGGTLSDFWQNRNSISKEDVTNIIRSNKCSRKDELLAILFWGVYFTVISATNGKSISKLIQFINNENFETEIDKRVAAIVDSNSPSELFSKFQNEYKIPGIDYAYFTKLFFFYRLANNQEPYLILDKWLSMAWCALEGNENKNTYVFNTFYKAKTDYMFDGVLKRKKPQAYGEYLTFMKRISLANNIDIITLEEKLFGTDLKKMQSNNPRLLYKNWALENNIPIKKHSKKKKRENLEISKPNIDINFSTIYLKSTQQYIGFYTDSNYKSKEGYVDINGWLCASNKLKNQLNELNWEEGNTQGGSKEKYKSKFNSQDECIEFLKERLK